MTTQRFDCGDVEMLVGGTGPVTVVGDPAPWGDDLDSTYAESVVSTDNTTVRQIACAPILKADTVITLTQVIVHFRAKTNTAGGTLNIGLTTQNPDDPLYPGTGDVVLTTSPADYTAGPVLLVDQWMSLMALSPVATAQPKAGTTASIYELWFEFAGTFRATTVPQLRQWPNPTGYRGGPRRQWPRPRGGITGIR